MVNKKISMTASPEVYKQRRAKLGKSISRPMMILAGQARARKYATNTHPFRAAGTYLYFGGPPLEGAAWLIEPGADGMDGCTLFRRAFTFDDAVWLGETFDDDALAAVAGIDSFAIMAPDAMRSRLGRQQAAAICPPCPESLNLVAALGLAAPRQEDLQPIIDMRLIKDDHELAAMRKAANVAVDAHRAAARAAKPNRREADALAAFMATLVANDCDPSFTPNITINGDVLHGEYYANVLEAGRLLLIDAGAEEPGGYTSDITRTYPVGGAFSGRQLQIYETVLRAEREAIVSCAPGKRFRDIHDQAAQTICEGLKDVGILRGEPIALLERKAHTLFFPHGLGHLIGLDVHDMEDFGDQAGYAPGRTRRTAFGDKFVRLDRDLQRGMTVTIEPGIYFVPAIWRNEDLSGPFADCVNRPVVEELLEQRFGGIRIEDTVHVRADYGPEILTADLPTDPNQVAELVGTE